MKILGNQMYKTKINATFKKNTKKQKWTQGKKKESKKAKQQHFCKCCPE